MMKIFEYKLINLILLLTFSLHAFSNMNIRNPICLQNDTISQQLRKHIPIGFEVLQIAKGNLNEDTLSDYAIIIRKPEERDSAFLLVLFEKQDNTFVKALETERLITTLYDNALEISNHILHVHTDEPWHGTNNYYYDIKYMKGDWWCIKESSLCSDPNNTWESSIDFVIGAFAVKHTVYSKNNKSQSREIKDISNKLKPYSITKDKVSDNLPIKYNGKEYYIIGRCDLWSDDEINK